LKRFSPPFSLRSRHFVVIGPTSDLHPRAAMVLREWRFWRPGYQPVDKPHPQRSCGRWRVQAEPCWPPVCLRRVPSLSVAVVDQGPLPGRGLAYGAKYDCHLRKSALPEAPDHFLRGARANYGQSVQATSLLPRPHYGRYVSSLLKEAAGPGGVETFGGFRVRSLHSRPERSHVTVQLRDGSTLVTKTGVLAAGNFPPANLNVPGPSQRCI
jgi:hypothetical protein